ncbi:MotA/TolQ/ExbB proton channel family protein [Algiphilus sp.]|uniref:MotA/TolQ/ExbB proton channel family protein n=1 Tax=Algiphilus sp. TaxID=1872431 RepID=UPI003C670882
MEPTITPSGPLAEALALGGPVVAVLCAMSVLGLAIVLLKLWQFAQIRIWERSFVDPVLADWHSGRREAALSALDGRRNPVAIALAGAMRTLHGGAGEATAREEAARVGARELSALRSYFRPLEVIGSLAPLLGLLGTVMGMIEAFRALEAAGSQVDPAILSGGIWEALLTTAVGLVVAIPAVAALNWLERIVERLHEDMQDALTRVFTRGMGAEDAIEDAAAGATAAHAH